MTNYKILRKGQPRPYADSELVVEVYLKEGLTKQEASDTILNMDIGYNDNKNVQPFRPKLSYLIEKEPGIWEFKMTSEYTG